MKALVVGTGSIGTRHINNLIKLGINVKAFSYRDSKITSFYDNKKISYLSTIEDALSEESDFVVIANTTEKHIEIALKAAFLSKHIYIEKPLSNSLRGLDELIKVSESRNLIEVTNPLKAS